MQKNVSKKLMPVAWHLTKWWNWSMPEDEKKKEIEPIFTDNVGR